MILTPDADIQNADWAKRSWDLPHVTNQQQLEEWLKARGGTLDHFMQLPIARSIPWLHPEIHRYLDDQPRAVSPEEELKRYSSWVRTHPGRGRPFAFESPLAAQIQRVEDQPPAPTVRDHRDSHTNSYAAALALLAISLRDRSVSPHEYHLRAQELLTTTTLGLRERIAGHYGADPHQVQASGGKVLQTLEGRATLAAGALGQRAMDVEKLASNAQLQSGGTFASGPVWALSHVLEGAAILLGSDNGAAGPPFNADGVKPAEQEITGIWDCVNDDDSCEYCIELDGQEWPLDEVPEWPGDGSQTCLGNCRCAVNFDASNPGGDE